MSSLEYKWPRWVGFVFVFVDGGHLQRYCECCEPAWSQLLPFDEADVRGGSGGGLGMSCAASAARSEQSSHSYQ